MKFDVALKDVPIDGETGRLLRTSRLYPCCTCRKTTGWRLDVGPDSPGIPMCSDECLDAWDSYRDSPSDDVSSGPIPTKV